MKITSKILLTFIYFTIFVVSCKKDSQTTNTGGAQALPVLVFRDPPPFDSCFEVPKPKSWLDDYDTILQPAKSLSAPSMNPNNSYEFVGILDSAGSRLCTYNIQTKSLKVILNEYPIWPKWSSKNWIVFQRYDGQVWKMRPDGSNLIKLTSSGSSFYPAWSQDGTKIAVWRQYNGDNYYLVLDENGKCLDTMKNFDFDNGSQWSTDGTKLSGPGGYYDFKDKSFHPCKYNIAAWFPGDKWVLSHYRMGLYRYNLETNELVRFKSECQNVGYDFINISKDGQHILFQRTRREGYGWNNIKITTRVGMMDLDGWNDHDIKP